MPVTSLQAATGMPLFGRAPFVTTQPFTYRDSYTLERYVEEIRQHLDELQSVVGELSTELSDAITSQDTTIANTITMLESEMASLRNELIALIEKATATGVIRNPVYGELDDLERVFGDVYDNVRAHALFAPDYDGMELTAQEYDGLELGAREYDLRATAVDNLVLGDFTGRDQFPYGKSLPPAEPITVLLTEADANERYVQRAPSVENFETQGGVA